jgi:RNA polymerase sigma-70 factor (ECF subfamily)
LRQSGLFGAYLWGETERVGKCCYKFTFFYKNKGVFVLSFKVTLSRLTTVLCDKRMERKKSMLESDRGKQFMTLYTKVQRRLYGYVLSNIPNPSDVDDIVQETVSILWSEFDKYQPGTNFSAWTLCIARYQILSHRKRDLKKNRLFSEEALEAIQEVAESADNLEQERQKALRLCLNKIGENERKILYYRYEIGATLRSVSERLNINYNTLYTVLGRIHIALLNCVRKGMV